jgi:hypothetical protein
MHPSDCCGNSSRCDSATGFSALGKIEAIGVDHRDSGKSDKIGALLLSPSVFGAGYDKRRISQIWTADDQS